MLRRRMMKVCNRSKPVRAVMETVPLKMVLNCSSDGGGKSIECERTQR